MFSHKIKFILSLFISFSFLICQAQLPAFPNAKGFGKFSVGGRGGEVIFVTNLNDNGPGSFRAACEIFGPRTVIFKIGGTITLNSTIEIVNSNITIAGQTAPGGGICLKMNDAITSGNLQATLAVITDDVIIRGLRFRAGPSNPQTTIQINDCLDIWDGENIIIDHCSFTWGNDENIAIWSDLPNEHPQKITIQKSIIGQGLQKLDTGGNITRGFGMLVGGSTGPTDISIIENLFIHNAQRNPLLKSEQPSFFEMYNNVIYNYGFFGTDLAEDVNVNLISNLYLAGNNTSTNRYEVLIKEQASLYVEGNIGIHRPNNILPDWDIVGFNGIIAPNGYAESPAPVTFQSNVPFLPISNEIVSSDETYDNLITTMDIGASFKLSETGSGEFINNLDEVDFNLIQDLINNSGQSIFDTDIGSTIQYPVLEGGVAPLDSDNDGMPDLWEENCGLNINDPTDRNEIAFNNYTNLENYLNNVSCNINSSIVVNEDYIQISPNPFIDKIIVDGDFNNYLIKVLDANGQTVTDLTNASAPIEIDLTELGNGIYFILVQSQTHNKLIVQKIIKGL